MEKHSYHVGYITFKSELRSFDVKASNWEELVQEVSAKLPEDADFICSISYNQWACGYDD